MKTTQMAYDHSDEMKEHCKREEKLYDKTDQMREKFDR